MSVSQAQDDRLSLISPVGYNASTCGYCTPSGSGQRSNLKSSKSYGVWANNITPETYQQMIDRGWRRSGHYIYRPDCGYDGTCCPQIAIRIPVAQYRPRSDQKRAISALQKIVRNPSESNGTSSDFVITASHKGKYSARWDMEKQWKLIEWSEPDHYDFSNGMQSEEVDMVQMKRTMLKPVHQKRSQFALEERKAKVRRNEITRLPPLMGPKRRRFETTLRLAQCTPEKYTLFRSYQMNIHGESETKVSDRKGFERFLCKGPLMAYAPFSKQGERLEKPGDAIDIASSKAISFEQYHMEYRYEGKLVAVGVLDILPRCISSVYLFYDPDYSHLHLGKVSAIREMLLVKQLQRKKGMEEIKYYNLGLYIHSCPKMRYKADYHPAEVLDPATCEWVAIDRIRSQLDRGVRFDFLKSANGEPAATKLMSSVKGATSTKDNGMSLDKKDEEEEDDEDRSMPIPPPPGILNPTKLPNEMLALSLVFDHGRVNLLMRTNIIQEPAQLQKALECIAALGPLHNRVCLYF